MAFLAIAIGIITGVLSGLIGLGGRIFIVPALVYVFKMSQHEAQGTSLATLLLPIGLFGSVLASLGPPLAASFAENDWIDTSRAREGPQPKSLHEGVILRGLVPFAQTTSARQSVARTLPADPAGPHREALRVAEGHRLGTLLDLAHQ